MTEQDAGAGLPVQPGGQNKVFLPEGNHITAGKSCILRPARGGQRNDHVLQTCAQHSCNRQRKDHARKRHKNIHEPHQNSIHCPAEVSAYHSNGASQHYSQRHDCQRGENGERRTRQNS